MPYIKSQDYTRAVERPEVPGELNYAITVDIVARLRGNLNSQDFAISIRQLTTAYLDRMGMSYTNGNAVMGVLDCAARELRRRLDVVGNLTHRHIRVAVCKIERQLKLERNWVYHALLAPYEDRKIAENGDVYPKALLSGS